MLPIYSIYVALWFIQPRPLVGVAAFCVVAVLVGMQIEVMAWGAQFLQCAPEPALFHPQLGADLAIASGYYFGGAIAWIFLFRRFSFSIAEAFIIQGAFGLFLEQKGAAFLAGLAVMPAGILIWLYVFVVHGSIIGLARLLADPGNPREVARRYWHYPIGMLTALAGVMIGTAISLTMLNALAVLPDARPICAHPFW